MHTFWSPARRAIVATLVLLTVACPTSYLMHEQSLPPAPHVPTGVVQHKVGVHTRLADEVERVKIERSLDMVADMGASWIVELFPWAYAEQQQGHLNWDHADIVVNAAAERHLHIIARLDLVPDWARPEGSSSRLLLPSSYNAYARYVEEFVRHFQGKVEYVVIWNEPNLSFEWGYRPPDPTAYTALLRAVYARTKAANPNVQIVSAGLAPNLGQGTAAMNDLTYLEQMYAAGAGSLFDVLGAHSYGFTRPATEPAGADRLNFQRVALHRAVMERYGDAGKAVIVLETGWNDAPRWTNAVRPAQRVIYTVQAYEQAEAWPWLRALSVFEFRLPAREDNVNDYFTFVHFDFTPRAVYDAVRRYAHGEPPVGDTGKP